MPEPTVVVIGGITLLLVSAVISFGRFARLRQHIDESAAAVAAQRQRRDRLAADLAASGTRAPGTEGSGAGHAGALAEQVADAEDRLVAACRLHSAQVRAWNRLGRSSPWGLLRAVTGWRPLPEPPAVPATARVPGEGPLPAGDDGRG